MPSDARSPWGYSPVPEAVPAADIEAALERWPTWRPETAPGRLSVQQCLEVGRACAGRGDFALAFAVLAVAVERVRDCNTTDQVSQRWPVDYGEGGGAGGDRDDDELLRRAYPGLVGGAGADQPDEDRPGPLALRWPAPEVAAPHGRAEFFRLDSPLTGAGLQRAVDEVLRHLRAATAGAPEGDLREAELERRVVELVRARMALERLIQCLT